MASVAGMVALGLGVTACSGSGSQGAIETPTPTPTVSSTAAPPPTGGTVKVSGPLDAKPKVTLPKPFAVDKTTVHVVHAGTGPTLKKDDLVKVDYVGYDGVSSKVFDSSWQRNEQQVFSLTPGALIPGFIDGLLGQKVGSRVEIEIPPAQGYGPAGGNAQAGIGATDTLVFVVDIRAANHPAAKVTGKQSKPVPGFPLVKLAKGVPDSFAPSKAKVTHAKSAVLIDGHGPVLKKGQTIKFTYAAAVMNSGQPFDNTYGRQAVTVPLDANLGIAGMADQLVGKRVGSRVELVLPKALAHASQLPSGVKDKNATVVFVLDILGAI